MIQIAHANAAYENRWKTIDDAVIEDVLQSPTFDVYEGLMVRSDDGMWIFHKDQWVDLSAKSEVGLSLWKYELEDISYQGFNALDRWRECPNGAWILWAMRQDLIEAHVLDLATSRCVMLAKEYAYGEVMKYAANAKEFIDSPDVSKLFEVPLADRRRGAICYYAIESYDSTCFDMISACICPTRAVAATRSLFVSRDHGTTP